MAEVLVESERNSTLSEAEFSNKQKWIPLRLVQTEEQRNISQREGSIPPRLEDWRFSPSGQLGVSLFQAAWGLGFDIAVLDIYHKLWSVYCIKDHEKDIRCVYTYHMLNENTLIIVQMPDVNIVHQHVFQLDHENKTAELEKTITHTFERREELFYHRIYNKRAPSDMLIFDTPRPHLQSYINGHNYTLMVSEKREADDSYMLYVIPLDPEEANVDIQEFCIFVAIQDEDEEKLKTVTGPEYKAYKTASQHFLFDGKLHFTPWVQLTKGKWCSVEGVFITVDVNKLHNVHKKAFGDLAEMLELDVSQLNAMEIVILPFAKLQMNYGWSESTCTQNAAVVIYHPWFLKETSYDVAIHRLGSTKKTYTVRISPRDFINLHPCGSVLKFRMYEGSFYVKFVKCYRSPLKGIRRIIFMETDPLPLDENAKKIMETHDDYVELPETEDNSKDEETSDSFEFEEEYFVDDEDDDEDSLSAIHYNLNDILQWELENKNRIEDTSDSDGSDDHDSVEDEDDLH